LVYELTRRCGDIDVYVISGDAETPTPLPRPFSRKTGRRRYGWAMLTVLACTALSWLLAGLFAATNLVMIYLLGVLAVASRHGRGPSILASVLSVAAFDVFFVPPYFTLAVRDARYLFTFIVMLIVGVVISRLTVRTRAQAAAAHHRERQTAALYAMSRELARIQKEERRWLHFLASERERHSRPMTLPSAH
jgi:two-component system sensor histidine kinase KdpD